MHFHKIPIHLKKYIVNQDYSLYTAIDQSTWKFIMKISIDFFAKHAHHVYLKGLEKTGITLNKIPKIKSINKHLIQFGWQAVCVRGFIPPQAFMEFQSLRILPIAADMRTHEHLTYTPSPDIVHEAAGHAPIIANKDYSKYLINYGEIASKAIMSSEDMNLYYAIRNLSDIKGKPRATKTEIKNCELELQKAYNNISYISESSLLSRMNWWTVEYGLVGNIEKPKIYGAGLLSSVGEGENCLQLNVKKIPFNLDCIKYNYDITEQQPQLFVTQNFKYLVKILNQLSEQMSYKIGGIKGLDAAIKAKTVCTIEIDKTLQISGIFEKYIKQNNKLVYIKTSSPTQLCYKNKEIKGHNTKYHYHGYSTPMGKIKKYNKSIDKLSNSELKKLNIKIGTTINLEFKSSLNVSGKIVDILKRKSIIILITFTNCNIIYKNQTLFKSSWGNFDMICGNSINSVYGGPCDKTPYYLNENNKGEYLKYNVPSYRKYNKRLNILHRKVGNLNNLEVTYEKLEKLYLEAKNKFPNEWLILYEILEATKDKKQYWANEIVEYLTRLINKNDDLGRAIRRGLDLIKF